MDAEESEKVVVVMDSIIWRIKLNIIAVDHEVSLINIIIVPDLIQFQKHLTSFDTEPHLQVTIIIIA